MTLTDLRTGLTALLPHTTIDVAGHQLLIVLPAPINTVAVAVREDGCGFKVGGLDVRRPARPVSHPPTTPRAIADAITGYLRARLETFRTAAHVNLVARHEESYTLALDVLAASDFAALALAHLDEESMDVEGRRRSLDAEMARRVAELDGLAADIAQRRRALVMKAPGYTGPVLEPLSRYVDDEPLLDDEGGDEESQANKGRAPVAAAPAVLRLAEINCPHRKYDLSATYIVNADGEAMLTALVEARLEQEFGDWLRTIRREDIQITDLNEAQRAAYITLHGEPNAKRPWRYIKGNFCPLGNLCDRIAEDTGVYLADYPGGALPYIRGYLAELANN